MKPIVLRVAAALMLPALLITAAPQPARADAASTALWAAAAAAIIGTIYYDSHHRPYYRDRYGRTHYVSQGAADYYNSHDWRNTPPARRQWRDAHGTWHHGCC